MEIISRKEAKTRGLQYYFTGKPCKYGHIDIRYTTCGKCKTCQASQSKKWNQSHQDYFDEWRKSDQGQTYYKDYYKNDYVVNYIRFLFNGAKTRARRKDLEFTITKDDIIIPEYCPVLGMKLEIIPNKGHKEGDNSPSIDRIDSTRGYTPDNIIIISRRANRIKNNATPDELKRIYEFFKDK